MPPEELLALIEQLNTQAGEIQTALAAQPDADAVKSLDTRLTEIAGQLAPLTAQYEAAVQAKAVTDLTERVNSIVADIGRTREMRTERKHLFNVNTGALPDEPVAITLYKARKRMDLEAMQKVGKWQTEYKALNEGAGATGGYLVPPQYIQQIIEFRRASSPLRRFITVVTGVNSNLIYVPKQTAASTVAWVAENATKPASDAAFSQIAVNLFTLAGIAKISNQLLEDSSPAVDQIVRNDLGRSIGIEEDRAMIAGTGSGQPTGILNTSGITVTPASAQTAASIYDDIAAAIGRVQQNYFATPTAILMAPRTFTKMATAKDSAGRYLGQGVLLGSPAFDMPGQGVPNNGGAVPTVFGIPVIIDANMPTAQTVGGNTNRSSIVVGVFEEAQMYERTGMTMDVSSEAGTSFESNQTWFRAEERVGFTAARQTTAFEIVSDVGP